MTTISRRLVLNFPGFEPTGPMHQLDRISATAQKTGDLWGFTCERRDVSLDGERNFAIADFVSRGTNWETGTRIVQFSWNDVIDRYESVPFPRGLFVNFPKYLAFFADGTARKYWRASPRYWAFTIWPILQIGLSAIVSIILATWLTSLAGLGGFGQFLAVAALSVIATLLLCKWPGERWHMLLAINDWGFARDMVHRSSPLIESRYREFAGVLRSEIERSDHDEIIISGHSFGAVWAVAALALALEDNPDLLSGRNATFLALGSSLLKIALARDAQFLREWTFRIWQNPDLFWHEIQTKDDIIAFYKSDPRQELDAPESAPEMQIDRVNYKKSMERKRYNRTRVSFFRMHRQYILNQDKRVAFDYLLRLFGPLSSKEMAKNPELIARMA